MFKTSSLLNRRVLIVLIVTILAFLPILNAGFVNYDDPEFVTNNSYIQKASVDNIKAVWLGDACVLYVPLTICSYYIDLFFGGNAACFHSINLLLHLLNILLLYTLLQLLKLFEPIAFFVLIFFALNPVITESVCWITERKDVLYTFFLLFAAIFFLKDQQEKSRKYYYTSFIFFVLSCLSKPMAVSFPLVVAAYLYANGALKSNVIKLLPFIFVAACISFITYYFIIIKNGPIASTNISNYSGWQKSFLFISEIGFYFARHWWPMKISLFHFFPNPSELYSHKNLVCFAVGLGYIFCIYYFRYNKRIMALLVAWLVMVLPVMQIVQNNQSYVNERYFYLTLCLPVYLTGLFLQKLLNTKSLFFFSNSLLLIFASITFKQVQYWQDSETLFKHELSLDNKNRIALSILGSYHNSIGEFHKARPYLARALAIDSLNASCLNNYGWCLSEIGRPDSGISFLKSAIQHKKKFLEAHNNLGLCYLHCGEKEKAIEEFKIAEKIDRNHVDVMFNLGIIYFFNGKRELGINYLKNAAAKNHKRANEFVEKYKLCSLH